MSPSLRRLMKEATELTTSPSPHFYAYPVSDTNLFDWHFTITGPPAPSPYTQGIYHGRIILPPTYPLRPPSFRFLTPTGRFEVNREICLSISGHHEESWQPAWGIRTALLAIRSFMDGDAKGQVGGLDVPEEVRREYAVQSREWCCEGCGEGKTNGEALREWREGVCRERGVVVDEDGEGKRAVPKDESGMEKQEGNDTMQPSSTVAPSSLPVTEPEPEPMPQPQPSSSEPSSQQQQQQHQPTPQTNIPPQYQQPQAVAANSQSQSSNGPWLDRAIAGVLVALVFMIMRRILNAELEDYI